VNGIIDQAGGKTMKTSIAVALCIICMFVAFGATHYYYKSVEGDLNKCTSAKEDIVQGRINDGIRYLTLIDRLNKTATEINYTIEVKRTITIPQECTCNCGTNLAPKSAYAMGGAWENNGTAFWGSYQCSPGRQCLTIK
jgi:hypothetical protein